MNENLLSEQVRTDYGLTEDNVKGAPDLRRVLSNLETSIPNADVTLVTDGQLPLRQILLPEAQRKGIRLSDLYYRFHDLRKEFAAGFPEHSSASSVEDMLNRKIAHIVKVILPILKWFFFSTDLGLASVPPSSPSCPASDCQPAVDEARNIAAILQKLICDGENEHYLSEMYQNIMFVNHSDVRLHEPESIQTRLEQGIRSRNDAVDTDCCVRARGLPWQASDQDIARFFVGLNVAR